MVQSIAHSDIGAHFHVGSVSPSVKQRMYGSDRVTSVTFGAGILWSHNQLCTVYQLTAQRRGSGIKIV